MTFDPTAHANGQIGQGAKPKLSVQLTPDMVPVGFVANEIARGNMPKVIICYIVTRPPYLTDGGMRLTDDGMELIEG